MVPTRGGSRFWVALLAVSTSFGMLGATTSATTTPGAALDAALERLVAAKGGPPGIAVVVQTGDTPVLHTAGTADVTTGTPIRIDDHLRLASVAKAFSGAAALSVVGDGLLALDATIGQRLPDLPAAWSRVTLAQLLQHTSGIPDFSQVKAFQKAVGASLLVSPPPRDLLAYVTDDPLDFHPGSKYRYSNSDNVIVGLMVAAATGHSYEEQLATRVYAPLGLTATSLPVGTAVPEPLVHGYGVDAAAAPEDLTELYAAGWAWASGGVVSTPGDANRFIRGYASGKTTTPVALRAQYHFRKGSSEPPGPGTNDAGLALFRYRTRCGDIYGHTGNMPGFTQFIAATRDGQRSVTASVNAQITPKNDARRFADLRNIYTLAVCAALDRA